MAHCHSMLKVDRLEWKEKIVVAPHEHDDYQAILAWKFGNELYRILIQKVTTYQD